MITQEFSRLYKTLNPAQKKAVDTVEGAVMVIAGPGTGKTQVLTLRIANILLKTQVNPENILALTFTEAAAHEMRKRLLSIIGHDAYRVEVTTFHSFCNNFIKKHQEEFPNIIASDSINEIEQLQIVESCMDSIKLEILRPLGDISYYVKPVLSQINELKRENVEPSAFKKALLDFEKELKATPDLVHVKGAYIGKMKSVYQKQFKDLEKNKELLKVYESYQKKMLELKKYDYNDMLLEVIKKLVVNPYLLQYLQEKFQYFLVDEHQDTNFAQNKIIELLCNHFDNPNLFVVGDEKQAIFRFQGATLENFLYFKVLYPKASFINLSENYRSTKTILNATHAIISNNPKSTQILSENVSLLKKAKHLEEKIHIAKLSSVDAEYFWITEKIKKIIKEKPTSEIAVLARTNRDLFPFVTIFDSQKIPYIVESDSNILDDIEIQKFIILLKTINKNIKDEFVAKALLLDCFRIEPVDVFKLMRKRYEEKKSIWEILLNEKIKKELNLKSKNTIDKFVKLFMDRDDGFVKLSRNSRFDKVFVEVLNKSGLMEQILQKKHTQEILSRFSRLYDEVKEEVGKNASFSLNDFLKYIELLEKHDVSLKPTTHIIPDGSVRLMTVHKSKGLEFDCVFVVNVYDGHWGNQRKRGVKFHIPWEMLSIRLNKEFEEDENSDERRLFYVALTRARKNIFLSYSIFSQDGKEQIPSQFINEIPPEFVLDEDTAKFEKKLLSHQEMFLSLSEDKKNSDNLRFSKDYIRELFVRQGLSVSALNNYLECPWKFFFVNLIRIPETIDDAGLFGNAVHGALNKYITRLKTVKPTEKFLLKSFEEELSEQPITENEVLRFKKRGIEALKGFYAERLQNINKDAETEIDIKGIRINETLIINGKIDMIEFLGTSGFCNVTDFKTGHIKSRNEIEGKTKTSDGNYKRQLVFYKILLDKYKNGFYKMENGIIEFVEPNDRKKYVREIFKIEKKEEDELLKMVIKTGDEIVSLAFWDLRCKDKFCEYCKLRSFLKK